MIIVCPFVFAMQRRPCLVLLCFVWAALVAVSLKRTAPKVSKRPMPISRTTSREMVPSEVFILNSVGVYRHECAEPRYNEVNQNRADVCVLMQDFGTEAQEVFVSGLCLQPTVIRPPPGLVNRFICSSDNQRVSIVGSHV